MNEQDLSLTIAKIALDKHARAIEIIDVREKVDYADYVIVCSGRTERQVRAIADEIEADLKRRGVVPLGVEGTQLGQWVLLDYGGVVVHVLQEGARDYYDIEGLWLDARRVLLDEPRPDVERAAQLAE